MPRSRSVDSCLDFSQLLSSAYQDTFTELVHGTVDHERKQSLGLN